jgi:hypothetical protein
VEEFWGGGAYRCREILLSLMNKLDLDRKQNMFYDACPESKDTNVLNMYNIFNLQKRHCE